MPVLSLEVDMRRREFIILLGGAPAWPAVATAQLDSKKRLVGLIAAFNDKEMMPLVAAFRARMQELGWVEGQNIVFDVRTTSGDYAKLDTEAGSLVSAAADVIVAPGNTWPRRCKKINQDHTSGVHASCRSCWSAIDRQFGSSRWQCHGLD